MKTAPALPTYNASREPGDLRIAIVYEDFASGARAKHFADRLAERCDCACDLSHSLWRCGLLSCPSIAEEASRDAADSDFLILSLRGDRVPASSTRRWLKTQLDSAGERGAAMIFLSDGGSRGRRAAETTRHYLRKVCTSRDVPFFSLIAAPEVEPLAEDFRRIEAGPGSRRRVPVLS